MGGAEISFFSRGRIVLGREFIAKLVTFLKDHLSVGFESFDATFISVESAPESIEFGSATLRITT